MNCCYIFVKGKYKGKKCGKKNCQLHRHKLPNIDEYFLKLLITNDSHVILDIVP